MARRKQCTVCNSAERAHVELLLAKGDSFAAVARRFNLSHDAVARHWKRHCPEEIREALKPSARAIVARLELGAQVAEEGVSTLEHLRSARALLWQLLTEERAAGHTSLAVMAATQYTKVCSLIARITGEWAESPLITQNNLTVITQSPQVQEFLQGLMAELAAFPDAARAIVRWLEAQEADALEAVALPAPEHAEREVAP